MGLPTKVVVAVAVAALGSMVSPAPVAASALTVDGGCRADFGFNSPWRDFSCTASAAGGTGGYHYTWQSMRPLTVLLVDQGPSSNGYCSAYDNTMVQVTVTSGAETASTVIPFHCA